MYDFVKSETNGIFMQNEKKTFMDRLKNEREIHDLKLSTNFDSDSLQDRTNNLNEVLNL